jgi:hypothetical protein
MSGSWFASQKWRQMDCDWSVQVMGMNQCEFFTQGVIMLPHNKSSTIWTIIWALATAHGVEVGFTPTPPMAHIVLPNPNQRHTGSMRRAHHARCSDNRGLSGNHNSIASCATIDALRPRTYRISCPNKWSSRCFVYEG